jgi:hypothetical protein
MKYIQDFFNSTNCRSVLLLVIILVIHGYIKIREYSLEALEFTEYGDYEYSEKYAQHSI